MAKDDDDFQWEYIGPEPATVTIRAFDCVWKDYPSELAENLITLEKEGAIYSHFAIEGTQREDGSCDFGYYRIELTPLEIYQYVQASRAYELFQRAEEGGASFEEALAATGDNEIAERVLRYGDYGNSKTKDGTTLDIRGCLASFFPSGMEQLMCGGRPDRYETLPSGSSRRDRIALGIQILNSFPIIARGLSDRKHGRPTFAIETEYDVQDLLYACLRGSFEDVQREEWTPQIAGSAKRIDIIISSIETLVEAKFVRDKRHANRLADELRVDFECYHMHEKCKQVLVLVYDPSRHIVDAVQFGDGLSGLRQKNGHTFDVNVLVR